MPPPALPKGFLLRPATAADRWQIRRLLQNFDRESRAPIRERKLLGWLIITAVLLWVTVSLGTAMVLLAIVALATALLWIQVSLLVSKDWQQYWVIVDCREGQLIACAKLCRYRHYSLLFNLLVAPAYRRCGFGSVLVSALSQKAVKPLYLACYADRLSFYSRLGFRSVGVNELTAIVRNELGIMPHSRLLALKLDED